MGSGKTLCSKAIGQELNLEVYDTDRIIESNEGLTIPDIFTKYGEKYFRNCESQVIQYFSKKDNIVVATGGGLPCHNNNMDKLNEMGTTIYLKSTVEELVYRLEKSHQRRPLIQGKNHDELIEFVTENLEKRDEFYSKADIVYHVQGRDISQLVAFLKYTHKN